MEASRAGSIVVLCFILGLPAAAEGVRGDIRIGKGIAEAHCARCHSIDVSGQSPLALAKPFRDLHELYPVEHLEEALAEGIMTGHPGMPQFRFEPNEIDDLITYLQSLEDASQP